MEPSNVSYTLPVSRSFSAVGRVLFKPFDIGKWFVLGFSAWLAALLSGGSSFSGNYSGGGSNDNGELEDVMQVAGQWIQENMTLIITLAVVGLLIGFAIYVALLWVSSRGKFMFLDNLVHNRALVKAPWAEFKTLGNSLFWWRLVYGVIVTMVVLAYVCAMALIIYSMVEGGGPKETTVVVLIGAILLLLPLLLIVSYITSMLEHFVIPIMYRDRIRVRAAWGRFLSLHRANFWKFVLYFLWSGLLSFAAGMALMSIGIMTCCIGMFIMVIPYIGAVVILPVTSFFRFLGPEFLRQFGEEYDIFPKPPESQVASETPAEA